MSSEIEIINIIENYDVEALGKWLDEGGNPNLLAGYNENKTFLIQYVLYGIDDFQNDEVVIKMLKLLIKKGANVNNDVEDEYPILYAVIEQKLNIVKVLLDAGANIDITDETGRTPLTSAVLEGDIEILELLLNYSTKDSIDKVGSVFVKSPLGIAFLKGKIEMIELLLRHGADPYMKDIDNMNLPMIENISSDIDPKLRIQISRLIDKYN